MSWARQVPVSLQVKVEQNRFPSEVAKIKAAGVDAIYYAGYEVECPYLRADLRDAGLDKLTFMASDGCFLAATIDNADGAAEGMYVTGFAPSPKTAVDQAWVQAYQAVEYRNPDTYSVNGYSAMQVLAEGVKQAGSAERRESRRGDPQARPQDAAGRGAVSRTTATCARRRSTSSRSRTGSSCRWRRDDKLQIANVQMADSRWY